MSKERLKGKKLLWIKGGHSGVYIGNTYRTFIKGLIKFPIDFIKGKYYGYPTCCVLYYCIIQMIGLPAAAVTRHFFETEYQIKNYAQCPDCLIPKIKNLNKKNE